jgi:hypothetical protein
MPMQVTYLFRYFDAEGGMIRMCIKQCADREEAMRLAIIDCGECHRIQISTGDRIIWSGSIEQAKAA